MDKKPHLPCPACGYLVFAGPPGSYDICPVCFWEDDGLQLEFATTLAGGANHMTLFEWQARYAQNADHYPDLEPCVHLPGPAEQRDPAWRPIDRRVDRFPDWDAPRATRAPHGQTEALYYWHPLYWMRGPSDG